MGKLINQFIRYVGVGVLAFAIDYMLLLFFTELAHIPYLISAGLSFVTAITIQYFISMKVVFSHKEELSRKREFALFFCFSIAGLALNLGLMGFGVELLSADYRIVKVFSTAIVGLFNFFTRRKLLDEGAARHSDDDRTWAQA